MEKNVISWNSDAKSNHWNREREREHEDSHNVNQNVIHLTASN